LDRLGLPLEPTDVVGHLTVARQQMVEIAKALSFNARVLIMDEPTAALNDVEVQTLFGLIRRFVTPTTGVIYISHRMHELSQITDRVTVLRDGRYIDTLDTASTTVPQVISLMVGREIKGDQRPRSNVHVGEPILAVRGLRTKSLLRDVSFEVRRGEILGFAGLMGAGRTEVARALYGSNEGAAIGVVHAVQELGITGKLTIIGFDSGKDQIDAIKSGLMAGAITQNPVGIGYETVKAAAAIIKGETVPKNIDTGYYWYDKTNIDDPKIAAVLYQ
jgi:ribose transport system ATP-binding protein